MARINLLLLENDEGSHYTWIRNINRLFNNSSKDHAQRYFCERCITSSYTTQADLDKHKEICEGIEDAPVCIEMPKEGKNIIKFRSEYRKMMAPFVIYADFECLNEKVLHNIPDEEKSSTTNVQKHVACSFCYIVVRSDGKVHPPVEYRGPNAAEKFLESLQETERKIREKYEKRRW